MTTEAKTSNGSDWLEASTNGGIWEARGEVTKVVSEFGVRAYRIQSTLTQPAPRIVSSTVTINLFATVTIAITSIRQVDPAPLALGAFWVSGTFTGNGVEYRVNNNPWSRAPRGYAPNTWFIALSVEKVVNTLQVRAYHAPPTPRLLSPPKSMMRFGNCLPF